MQFDGNWNTWVVNLVTILVSGAATWVLAEVVRFLRTRVSLERQAELHTAAMWVVQYVEQEFRSGRIVKELRLEQALAALQERVPWATSEMARQAIEAAVLALKRSLVNVPPPK